MPNSSPASPQRNIVARRAYKSDTAMSNLEIKRESSLLLDRFQEIWIQAQVEPQNLSLPAESSLEPSVPVQDSITPTLQDPTPVIQAAIRTANRSLVGPEKVKVLPVTLTVDDLLNSTLLDDAPGLDKLIFEELDAGDILEVSQLERVEAGQHQSPLPPPKNSDAETNYINKMASAEGSNLISTSQVNEPRNMASNPELERMSYELFGVHPLLLPPSVFQALYNECIRETQVKKNASMNQNIE